MAKSGKAPVGYYSATQVMRRLGIGSSTLYHFVEVGKIKRIVPPNMRDGYYAQTEVDKMVRERELFLVSYSKDKTEFTKAREEDIQGIYDVTNSLWNKNPSYEDRLNGYKKNPYTYYVAKKEGIVVGFLGLLPLSKESLKTMMQEDYKVTPEAMADVLPFIEGQPIDNLFLDIAVRKGIPQSEPYGMRLIQGGLEAIESFATQGSPIRMLYAASSTPFGIKLCRDMGFTELPTTIPGASRKRFEIDLSKSKSPFLRKYQKIIKEQKK